MREGVNYQRALEAIRLKVQINDQLRNDISVLATSLINANAAQAINMVCDQYLDNPNRFEVMLGQKLINSILQYQIKWRK